MHSKAQNHDDDLRNLAAVEDPASSTRVIVAVDKLKEGWDVKNVYVLASLRASVSTILTEQTLGRGLRLPFGKRTGVEFLDTLEVIAHERFEELLRNKHVLNQQFVSYRASQKVVTDRNGNTSVRTQRTESSVDVLVQPDGSSGEGTAPPAPTGDGAGSQAPAHPGPSVATLDGRVTSGAAALVSMLAPKHGAKIEVPILVTRNVRAKWSLAQVTDMTPFRDLAQRIAKAPEIELRRTVITAQRADGSTALGTRDAADKITGYQEPLPLDDAKNELRDYILRSKIAPARTAERKHLERILGEFYEGLGDQAEKALTAHWRRAATRIITLIEDAARNTPAPVNAEVTVELTAPFGTRQGRATTTQDRYHKLEVSERNKLGYEGWSKSLYPQVWFDSDTERQAAVVIDDSSDVELWIRLHDQDLPIAWSGESRTYNPDFLVKTTDGTWWIVEVKADSELASDDVAGKAQAARVWVNHVNADDKVDGDWKYLLVGETDVRDAKGSWQGLTQLGR